LPDGKAYSKQRRSPEIAPGGASLTARPFIGTAYCPKRYLLEPLFEETDMDWNRVEGNWKQVKGKVKEQWGKLTDDDLDVISGKRDQLEGKIQERYGTAKDQVKKDVDDWYGTQRW
jgi:uncharacterized protein YjbJ (UPF0337 family)